MISEHIRVLYFILLGVGFIIENWLVILNLRYIRKKSRSKPAFINTLYSDDEFALSVKYTNEKGVLSIVKSTIHIVMIVGLIISGLLGSIDSYTYNMGLSPLLYSILYVFIITTMFYIVDALFAAYTDFLLERKYGFSTVTVKTWIIDQIKSLFISGLVFIILLFAIIQFLSFANNYWWLYSYITIVIVQLLIIFVYPVLIAPLFNKFEQLEEGELRTRLTELANKTSFPISDISVMDASRRSKHSNAYFTGFGKIKRIVLFDTLVSQLTTDEIASVIAHEIGHNKKKHILKSFIVSFLLLFLIFLSMHLLQHNIQLFSAFGFSAPSIHGLIILMLYFSSPFLFFLTPLFSFMSRKNEYEADYFAFEAMGESKNLASALSKIAAKNLSNLLPHPWYSAFHYSHPTLEERLKKAEAYKKNSGEVGN